MLDEFFLYDGVSSRDVGLQLQKQITFTGAIPRLSVESVPGRNGDLHYFDGSYENRTGTAFCYLLQKDVDRALDQINRWSLLSNGYRRLETSEEPDVYRLARITAGPEVDIRARILAPFTLEFDCKPQKFLKSGEEIISLTEPITIYNPDFEALPLITVYGTGSGVLYVGDYTVTIHSISGYIVLDSDTQNAYKDFTNKNGDISALEFPRLKHGENSLGWTGDIERIEIIPRWCKL